MEEVGKRLSELGGAETVNVVEKDPEVLGVFSDMMCANPLVVFGRVLIFWC